MWLATKQRLVFLAVYFSSLSATAEDKLTCPSEWEEGEQYTLTCTVRTSEFNSAKCPYFSSGLVDFQFTLEGSDPSPQCTVQNVTASCGDGFNTKGCRCREKTSEAYVLEFKVQAKKALHEDGKWTCVPQCAAGIELDNKYEKPPYADNLQCGPVSVSSAGSALFEHRLFGMKMSFLLLLISLSAALISSSGMGMGM